MSTSNYVVHADKSEPCWLINISFGGKDEGATLLGCYDTITAYVETHAKQGATAIEHRLAIGQPQQQRENVCRIRVVAEFQKDDDSKEGAEALRQHFTQSCLSRSLAATVNLGATYDSAKDADGFEVSFNRVKMPFWSEFILVFLLSAAFATI